METPIKIGLPVMMHYEKEVQAFLAAKERIESGLANKLGLNFDVGVFLYFTANALNENNRKKQLENQKKYKLPILHCQTPIQREHSICIETKDAAKNGCLLETAIEQCAELKNYDRTNIQTAVDTHTGIVVFDDYKPTDDFPGVFSLKTFCQKKAELLKKSRNRFYDLAIKAMKYGLDFVLENSLPVVLELDRADANQAPRLHYLPFSDLKSLLDISDKSITLDIAHLIGGQYAPTQFDANGVDKKTLFETENVHNSEEYLAHHPQYTQYLAHAKILHLSNTQGIGVRLEKYPELEKKWGGWGTEGGLLDAKDLRKMFAYAHLNGLPVMIEVDYDIKKIPEKKFSEADDFIKFIFEDVK